MLGRGRISRYLHEKYHIADEPTLRKEIGEMHEKIVEQEVVEPLSGAIDLVTILRHEYPLGIGSASNSQQIMRGLQLFGVRDAFRVIVGGDMVERPKPDPETYVEVARRLQIDPMRCLVFEDSTNGITAAKAAGMRCIAVPNK